MDTEPDTVRKPWIETPLIESATFSQLAGCRIFLKLELLQPSGSFKSRGVGNLILKSVKDPANAGKAIHFYSSSGGNAGLAAVCAARDLNCACTVVVPDSTNPLMVSKLRNAGATMVIQQGRSWSEADTYLRENFIDNQESGPDAETTVNVYVPPFDHPLIWEGAATMIDELARQLPTPLELGESDEGDFPADAILCSVGGGGLFNGVIEGLETHFNSAGATSDSSGPKRKVHVLAVETVGANSLAHSVALGRLTPLPAITSKATSLGALCVAKKTFRNAESPPNGIKVDCVVGTDLEAAKGVVRLADDMRLQVELACGISLETAVSEKLHRVLPHLTPQSRVVVIICGGSNVNAEMIAKFRECIHMGWE